MKLQEGAKARIRPVQVSGTKPEFGVTFLGIADLHRLPAMGMMSTRRYSDAADLAK